MHHQTPTIADRIKRIISNTLADVGIATMPEYVPVGDTFSQLGADHTDLRDIIHKVEDEFGIEVPDDAVDTGSTVAELIAAVAGKREVV